MLIIYTRSTSPFTKEFWKWVARRVTRKYSGPNAVEDSLLRGLHELNIPCRRNVKPRTGDTVIVLSGVIALHEAIHLKQKGVLRKLIAGPNVVAHPNDFDALIQSKFIDYILVPAQWVADFWAGEAPTIANKVVVWPSGVRVASASLRNGLPIIYNKLGDNDLVSEIKEIIGGDARFFNYGSFKHNEYITALTEAPYLIYLAQSESQGLALQEAWSHDVPTLINKSTEWQSESYVFKANQINCPYLTPELGTVFEKTEDIPLLISKSAYLHPKNYCDTNLSDHASAQLLRNLL